VDKLRGFFKLNPLKKCRNRFNREN